MSPPGPAGILRVPSALVSALEFEVCASAGIPALGYFAQVPHYISGPYPAASVALLETLGQHLGVRLPTGELAEEAQQLRTRLDAAAAIEETTRTYVERLEAMADEQRLPAGDDLIADIERFLREGGGESTPALTVAGAYMSHDCHEARVSSARACQSPGQPAAHPPDPRRPDRGRARARARGLGPDHPSRRRGAERGRRPDLRGPRPARRDPAGRRLPDAPDRA